MRNTSGDLSKWTAWCVYVCERVHGVLVLYYCISGLWFAASACSMIKHCLIIDSFV